MSADTSQETASRPLNAFETVFAACNVRFAILLEIEGGAALMDVEMAIEQALQHSQIAYLKLKQQDGGEEWFLQQQNTPCALVEQFNIPPEEWTSDDLTLQIFLMSPNNPAKGGLKITIVQKDSVSTKPVHAIVVNGNHALVDGRSLVGLVTEIAKNLNEMSNATNDFAIIGRKNLEQPSENIRKLTPLVDWKDLVHSTHFEQHAKWNADPPYLAPADSVLKISELSHSSENTEGDTFGVMIGYDILDAWKSALATKKSEGIKISMTAILVEFIMHSLRQELDDSVARSTYISVSVLVDLRPFLTYNKDLPQAISTITLSLPATAFDNNANSLDAHLGRAASLTQQLQQCIERGEHIRCARAFTSGQFDQASPPATIELSNLGVIDLPSSYQMYTAQRFDDYDGVSCMAHTEASSGIMRLNVSVGKGMPLDRVEGIFERMKETMSSLVLEST